MAGASQADLAAQVEAGGTLYGYREDGAYVARTRSGDGVIIPGARQERLIRSAGARHQATLHVVAGPNGSGKSTLTRIRAIR